MSIPEAALGPVDRARSRSLVQRLAGVPIAIVGDLMLDHFIFGRVTRISPEAPVPVVEFDHEEFRVGGAVNVARNARALGGSIELVALTGRDQHGLQVQSALTSEGVGTRHLVPDDSRPTTRKVRIVTSRNQQVARIDYEGNPHGIFRSVTVNDRLDITPKLELIDAVEHWMMAEEGEQQTNA